MNETSAVMLKPDGHARPEIRQALTDELAGLVPIDRFTTTLTPDDVLDVWPKLLTGIFPVSRAMLTHYMTSGPVEIVVVSGPDAVRSCRDLRDRLRERFGAVSFGNRAHAPGNPSEATANLAKFSALRHGRPFTRADLRSRKRGVWGRLAATPAPVIERAAGEIWSRSRRSGWDQVWRTPSSGPCPVVAGYDPGRPRPRVQSVDSTVSALYEAIPDASVTDALGAYVVMEARGFVTAATGTPTEAARIARHLTAAGIPARVPQPVRE